MSGRSGGQNHPRRTRIPLRSEPVRSLLKGSQIRCHNAIKHLNRVGPARGGELQVGIKIYFAGQSANVHHARATSVRYPLRCSADLPIDISLASPHPPSPSLRPEARAPALHEIACGKSHAGLEGMPAETDRTAGSLIALLPPRCKRMARNYIPDSTPAIPSLHARFSIQIFRAIDLDLANLHG